MKLADHQCCADSELSNSMFAKPCGIASPFGNPLVVKDLVDVHLRHSKKPFILV